MQLAVLRIDAKQFGTIAADEGRPVGPAGLPCDIQPTDTVVICGCASAILEHLVTKWFEVDPTYGDTL
jgi:hypothetical protein